MGTEIFETIPPGRGPKRPRGQWAKLSGALTKIFPELTSGKRYDIICQCSPGITPDDSPACIYQPTATVYIDGKYLPPGMRGMRRYDLSTEEERRNIAPVMGLAAHEAAHGGHTKWTRKVDERKIVDGRVLAAALVLEESRIEYLHAKERPQDQEWLHATSLILDIQGHRKIAEKDRDRSWAISVMAMIYARLDAGILSNPETKYYIDAATVILGTLAVSKLREIWKEAFETADNDKVKMLELGRRWVEVTTPVGPRTSAAGLLGGHCGIGKKMAFPAESDPIVVPGIMEPLDIPKELLEAMAKASKDAADKMKGRIPVKDMPTDDSLEGGVTGWRDPTADEKGAARKLAAALKAARFRERTAMPVARKTPPGRLRIREAMAGRAAEAAGAVSDAMPYKTAHYHTNPAPPVKAGVCIDISGSMELAASASAIAGWMIAYGIHKLPGSRYAQVTYADRKVRPVVYPGHAPNKVPEVEVYEAGDECVGDAVATLDGLLGLSIPGAARLLVIISDYQVTQSGQAAKAGQLIKRLLATGCHVLWITPEPRDSYWEVPPGHLYYPLPSQIPGVRWCSADGTDIIPIIGREVVDTLKDAK